MKHTRGKQNYTTLHLGYMHVIVFLLCYHSIAGQYCYVCHPCLICTKPKYRNSEGTTILKQLLYSINRAQAMLMLDVLKRPVFFEWVSACIEGGPIVLYLMNLCLFRTSPQALTPEGL